LRLQLSRPLDGFRPIAGFADDLYIGLIFQHAPKADPHQGVIVNK
jgi:hypothetical protein